MLEEIRKSDCFTREDVQKIVDDWSGNPRTFAAIRIAMLRLAEKHNVLISVPGAPKIGYNNRKAKPTKKEAKSRFNQALRAVIAKEVQKAADKIFCKAWRMISGLEEENRELKAEVKNLRPFRDVAQREFSRQLSYQGK